MHVELQVAMNFIISYLYNKLPRTRVHLYGEELEKLLRVKFIGHWYPANPVKGSAFRCVHLNSSEIDPSFKVAAVRSGLDFINDIKSNLPAELSVWVDPGEVSYVIGGMDGKPGPVKVLFKDNNSSSCLVRNVRHDPSVAHRPIDVTPDHIELYGSNIAFNPHAKGFLPNAIDIESPEEAVYDDQSLTYFCYSSRPKRKLFTVDEFASTKFGSTKVKSDTRNTPNCQGPPQAGFRHLQMQTDVLSPPQQYVVTLSQEMSSERFENLPWKPVPAVLGTPSIFTSNSTTMQSPINSSEMSPSQLSCQVTKAKQDPNSTFRVNHVISQEGLVAGAWTKESDT